MKVVGYICSSIGSKVDKSLEFKIQREQIEKYCKEHNFKIVQFYEDELKDDNYHQRPALNELISNSKDAEYERVIVAKFDRLSHDKELRLKYYEAFADHSIEIFSVAEQTTLKHEIKEEPQAKINIVLRKVKDIPSLPEVVTKVMELVSNPKSSAAELSRVISHDPGLTTRVLRLVNSAYYGFPKQISSVQQAIMILGFTTMRGLVLSTSIFKIFTPKDSKTGRTIDYKLFWKHSISTALCSRVIATSVGLTEVGDAFSCGILHDIGKVVFDQYDHSDYVEIFKLLGPKYTSEDLLEMETKIIGINHGDIGYRVADKWNLPVNLSETIRCHHTPLDSLSHTKLVSVVYLANILANMIAQNLPVLDHNKFDPHVLDYLKINQDKLYSILSSCREEVDKGGELDSFFE